MVFYVLVVRSGRTDKKKHQALVAIFCLETSLPIILLEIIRPALLPNCSKLIARMNAVTKRKRRQAYG